MEPHQGFLRDSPLFPPRASEMARDIDTLFFATLGVTVFFSTIITILLFYFMVRYRRRYAGQIGQDFTGNSTLLETAWIVVPLVISLGIFAWGARIYFAAARPPADAQQYYVVGKQWMWKIEHPSGKREINELHVPRGQAVKLKMTSEDVIHSFYIPAMRVKTDVVPGKYTTLWFNADTVGTYHLFCSQYCGTEHSRMVGRVIVMDPMEYELWIAGSESGPSSVPSGEELFAAKACNTCHRPDTTARAPMLWGLFGRSVLLQDGYSIVADEAYIRESIVNPAAKVVLGYQPIMPTYRGQLSEEEIIQLIRYVQAMKAPLGAGGEPAPAASAAPRSAK
jgi:cytochrome c oxidase subunit II